MLDNTGLQPRKLVTLPLQSANGGGLNPSAFTFQVLVIRHGADWFVHASVATSENTCVRWQPLVMILPATQSSVLVPPQLSVTVTSALTLVQLGGVGLHPRSMLLDGHPLITGGVVSCTVIVWSHVEKLPQASAAFQVRVITFGQVPLVTSV